MKSAAASLARRRRERFVLGLGLLVVLLALAIPASAGNTLALTTVSPANGQKLSGSVTWQVAVASSNVDRVEFLIDGSLRWTEHVSPWLFNGVSRGLNTTGLSDGTHVLTAKAYAKNGKSTGSSSVTVTVANAPPAPPPPPPPAPPPPPPPATAPTSTALPLISGSPTVGQTLSASAGSWSGSTPMSYAYSWSRCNSSGGSCVPISGAAAATYRLASGDVGSTMRVSVTATNAVGSATATSAATAAVVAAPAGDLGTALPPRMPESSGASVRYVSTTGSDANAGTLASPFKTLSKALSTATSGTVIYLRGGSYGTQAIYKKRFSPANPVTIRSYPGEIATFVGQTTYANAVTLTDCQGIRLRDLVFDARYNTNLKIETSQHIEIDRVVVRNAGMSGTHGLGLLVSSNSGYTYTYNDDIQVWDSTFYNNGKSGGYGADHQIYFGGAGNLKGSATEHGVRSGVFANNLVYDGPAGYALTLGGAARHVIVTNNTFVHQYDSIAGSAIVVWNGENTTWGTRDCLIVNNIFTNNAGSAVVASASRNVPSNVVRNNLTYANGRKDYVPTYGSLVGFTLGTNIGPANPLFVDPTHKDFHLQPGSPALAKADPAYTPPTDASGTTRPLYSSSTLASTTAPALGAFG